MTEETGDDSGPGAAYQQFVIMEEFLDKLKLLHYESGYCKQLGYKPFSRHYFALPTNPGEQFFAFTSICAWILQMCGKSFDQPQEYDDPNSTIANILSQLRELGHQIDFPPNKLKVGCGEACLWVMDRLADEALKAKTFSWKVPEYPEEEAEEENIIEDDTAELNLNKVEEEMILDDDEEIEEEENILGLDDLKKLNSNNTSKTESSKPENIMESTTDATEWKMEVERVLPQLKVTIRTDNKDWRVHMDQMILHNQGIEKCMTETRGQLDKLHDEITKTLEKISSREKYINNQLEHLLVEFRTMQDQMAETKEKYRQGSGGVTERSRILAEIVEDLEKIKQEMEERGTNMTDAAPLVRIKQSMKKVKEDSTQIDIRIGVIQHILLQAKLKEKSHQNGGGGMDIIEDDGLAY